MSRTLKWTVGMTAFGIIVSVCVYAATASFGWAAVGLLLAGVVGNVAAGSTAMQRRP